MIFTTRGSLIAPRKSETKPLLTPNSSLLTSNSICRSKHQKLRRLYMNYIITFLEGIITFISPCLLPMLPIYISYFAGGGERSTGKTVKNAFGFILGFTVLFVLLGALAGTLGSFLIKYRNAVNIVLGLVMIFFGLSYMGVFKFNIFKGNSSSADVKDLGFFSSVAFGIIFSIGWTPCVGTFLSAALMQASVKGTALSGMIKLF